MTAIALDMHEWIESFHTGVGEQLDEIHPHAQCICHGCLHFRLCLGYT